MVGNSEAAFLAKLNLKPFMYGMDLHSVYNDGEILDKAIAKITPESLLKTFQQGVSNLTGLSLETGLITAVAVPHLLVNSFKNLLAVAVESGYKLDALEKALSAASAAPKQQAAAANVESKKAVVEEKVEAPVEEDMDMGDLFG